MKKATNIIWDVDNTEDLEFLPTKIFIPDEIGNDEDDISDYISDMTGFCHKGFTIEKVEPSLCSKCAYNGDKFSFPIPNDKPEYDPDNLLIRCNYCCCGDCKHYGVNHTYLEIQSCPCFEEL